jgi:hypothetical protein
MSDSIRAGRIKSMVTMVCSLIAMMLMLSSNKSMAQNKQHATWKINSVRLNDDEVMITFQATLDSGWHLYSQNVLAKEAALHVMFNESKQYSQPEGVQEESKAIYRFDPFFKQSLNRFEHHASFSQRIKVTQTNAIVNGTVQFTVGSDGSPPVKEVLHFSVAVSVRHAKDKVALN